jgi:hypothetical protein
LIAAAGDTIVTLSWGPPAAPATLTSLPVTGYVVERSSTSATAGFSTIGTTLPTIRSFVATELINGFVNWFRVSAVNAVGTGAPSLVVSSMPVAGTVTVLTSSDTDVNSGASVTFTATVTTGGAPVSTGSVTFKRGPLVMASGVGTNVSGVATFTTSAIPVGSWGITAVYDGAGLFPASTSNTVVQLVQFAGGPEPTTAALTSSDATAAVGQTVTFTVTVTRTTGGLPVTTGSVTFRDGLSLISAAIVVNPSTGAASYTLATLTEGTHDITATYNGAPVYVNSTSNVVSQVIAVPTGAFPVSQTLLSSKPLAVAGEVLMFRTLILTSANPTDPVVTEGSVVFKEGTTVLGAGTPPNIYGESTFDTTSLSVGTHLIHAEYTGMPAYENDVSTPITQIIAASVPAPSPNTWQAAYDSNDLATITAWYDYNTGHLTGGFTNASLWNPAAGTNNEVLVNAAWLAAHAAPGRVVNTVGSNWTVTGLYTTKLSIQASNVTFEHCWFHRTDYASNWGQVVGFETPSGSDVDVSYSGTVLNYCTISSDGTGAAGTWGDAIFYDPVTAVADGMVANHCEITRTRAGWRMYKSATMNYCWVHDLNLYGFEPHNTAASIRDQQCRIYRNLLCDGTSSDVSLYADNLPFTNFWVTENTMWVDPRHANYEVNFPAKVVAGIDTALLEPGYVRELVGNKLQRGEATDNKYFSKITGNTYIDGEPLFGGADTVQVTGEPTCMTATSTAWIGGHNPLLATYHYTPTPSSTQLLFHGLGRAGSPTASSLTLADSTGDAWTVISETPVENAPGDLAQYGISGSLWKQQSTSSPTQTVRHVDIDPYTGSSQTAYQSALVIEVTGRTGLTLAKPVVQSAVGHLIPYGTALTSITSGTLASAATSGHLVLLFVAYVHEVYGFITPPAGWEVLGYLPDERVTSLCLWRDDFTGSSVTISGIDPALQAANAVTILCEFA